MSLDGLRQVTDQEKKVVLLEILNKLDMFFRDNNIEYFLADGTLIGAIRHKGFIPWDDDVDILVPRDSFIKLIHLAESKKEYLAKNNLEILEYGANKKDYYKRFKFADTRTVMEEFGEERSAVFVDIFPLDFFKTNSLEKAKKLRKKILKLDNLCSLCNAGVAQGSGVKRKIYGILLFAFKCFGLNNVKKAYESKILKLTSNSRDGIASASETGLGDRDFSLAKCWAESIDVEFEGVLCKVPAGYHQVLTNEYGDYMQLPPENERYSHEYYKMYWKR